MSINQYNSNISLTDFLCFEKALSAAHGAGKMIHFSNNVFQGVTLYLQYALEELDPKSAAYRDINNSLKIIEDAVKVYKKTQQSMHNIHLNPDREELHDDLEFWVKNLQKKLPQEIKLKSTVEPGSKILNVDQFVFWEVLDSLVENATEQMPNGGLLSVSIGLATELEQIEDLLQAKSDHYLSISIHDEGAGFSEANRSHLFEPLTTGKDVKEGHGLSLTRAFFFAKKSGGFLRISSSPRTGTMVELILPTVNQEAVVKSNKPINQPFQLTKTPALKMPESLKGKRVLIADDNPVILDVCSRILQQESFTVFSAENGEKALEIFGQELEPLDLVIMDIIMPNMMGTEVAELILKQKPHTCILLTSGYYKSVEEAKVFHPAIKGILQKPFSRDQLLFAITNALSTSLPVS